MYQVPYTLSANLLYHYLQIVAKKTKSMRFDKSDTHIKQHKQIIEFVGITFDQLEWRQADNIEKDENSLFE